jgi:hypothetical protein
MDARIAGSHHHAMHGTAHAHRQLQRAKSVHKAIARARAVARSAPPPPRRKREASAAKPEEAGFGVKVAKDVMLPGAALAANLAGEHYHLKMQRIEDYVLHELEPAIKTMIVRLQPMNMASLQRVTFHSPFSAPTFAISNEGLRAATEAAAKAKAVCKMLKVAGEALESGAACLELALTIDELVKTLRGGPLDDGGRTMAFYTTKLMIEGFCALVALLALCGVAVEIGTLAALAGLAAIPIMAIAEPGSRHYRTPMEEAVEKAGRDPNYEVAVQILHGTPGAGARHLTAMEAAVEKAGKDRSFASVRNWYDHL